MLRVRGKTAEMKNTSAANLPCTYYQCPFYVVNTKKILLFDAFEELAE